MKVVQKNVTLANPIVRGEQTIEEVTINKPTVATLKGLQLLNVMQLEVNALCTLLPRVTQPMLSKADLDKMDVEDFTALTVELLGFFTTQAETPVETTETAEMIA